MEALIWNKYRWNIEKWVFGNLQAGGVKTWLM